MFQQFIKLKKYKCEFMCRVRVLLYFVTDDMRSVQQIKELVQR